MTFLFFLLLKSQALSEALSLPVVTYDPTHTPLSGYQGYFAKYSSVPLNIQKVYKNKTTTKSSKFFVIVNSTLYSSIQTQLDQYITDLETNYNVEMYTLSSGTDKELKKFLCDSSLNLVGAVFIGDLPIAWYEIHLNDGWPTLYEEFPCDLFYMDLDGEWTDTNPTGSCQSGVWDGHTAGTGDMSPEIWIGRLTAGTLAGWGVLEKELVNKYLKKTHKYRTGGFTGQINDRALEYIDNDWVSYCYYGVDTPYPDSARIVIVDYTTTCAVDYKNRLTENYAWIHLMCHSSPTTHYFGTGGSGEGTVNYNDIKTKKPLAHFYSLYACSNCRYTEQNYMGGWYTFVDSCGLSAIGSTKTGGMFSFHYFFEPLALGKCLGEAFKNWWCNLAPFDDTDKRYWYGMTLLGDPTLVPRPQIVIEEKDITREFKIKIQPNPFSHRIVIKLSESQASARDAIFIQIYDLSGKIVYSLPVTDYKSQSPQFVWDARGYPTGVYIVKLSIANYNLTKKVILLK